MNDLMTTHDLLAISPLIILMFSGLGFLLLEAFAGKNAKYYAFPLGIAVLLLAFYAAYAAPVSNNPYLTYWISLDALTRYFNLLFIGVGLASTLIAYAFFKHFEAPHGEFLFFLFSCLFGLLLVGMSADFLTLFLGIETLSISLYILCGYMKNWKISHEAAIKYFLMGALAAAFLLYGIALIYGAVGTTHFADLLPQYNSMTNRSDQALFLSGIALVTLGLCFKAAIVPFHTWAPDVYAGAPTPVTAFMAVGTKIGAFAALTRVFLVSLYQFNPLWNDLMAILAIITLVYANFVALQQVQLRRFFAYSGISHAGFLLIPFAAQTPESMTALLFYLAIYAFATLGAFAVLIFLDHKKSGVMVEDLKGLFHQSPISAMILAICLLTLAGLPPTVGFLGKFYLFKLAFQAGYLVLLVTALIMTVISAFYYVRMIGMMMIPSENQERFYVPSWPAATVAVFSFAGIVFLSIYPQSLLAFVNFLGLI